MHPTLGDVQGYLPRNLVLVGYRGTGKSTVGLRLAERLSWQRVSLDEELVRREGRSIPALVEAVGWDGFRERESALVLEVSGRSGWVLDCGGGVVEREGNFEPLRSCGQVVWLRAEPATIIRRIGGDANRPSLTGKSITDEVVEVLARRSPLYQRLSHFALDTDQTRPQALVDQLLQHLRYAKA